MSPTLLQVAEVLTPALPFLLVMTAGIIVAAINLARHPLPSVLVLIACSLGLVVKIGGAFVFTWLVAIPNARDIRASLKLSAFVQGALQSASVCLLLTAVYIRRRSTDTSNASQSKADQLRPQPFQDSAQRN